MPAKNILRCSLLFSVSVPSRYTDAIRLLKLLLSRFDFDGWRGYWTLSLSIDLEHIGHLGESQTVAEEGVLDPWVRSGSKMATQRRILHLGKPPRRWKIPSFAKSINRKIKEVNLFFYSLFYSFTHANKECLFAPQLVVLKSKGRHITIPFFKEILSLYITSLYCCRLST